MNALRHLLREHEEIDKLFHQFVEAGEDAHETKRNIANEVIEKITMHKEEEERFFFAPFKEKGGEEAEELVTYGTEEHKVAEFIMGNLKKMKPEDKRFDAWFKILMESTKTHFMEEEKEIFPKAKKVLTNGDLDRLGKEMETYEKQIGG